MLLLNIDDLADTVVLVPRLAVMTGERSQGTYFKGPNAGNREREPWYRQPSCKLLATLNAVMLKLRLSRVYSSLLSKVRGCW